MANPNWPSFPGLANLTQDGDGRPQVLDLIPGKQRGTPLNTQLFNPIIRKLCDLQDASDGVSASAVSGQGYLAGDLNIIRLWRGAGGVVCVRDQNSTVVNLAQLTDVQNEQFRATTAEAKLLPLNGSQWMSGPCTVAYGQMLDGHSAGGFVSRFEDGTIAALFNVGLDEQNYPYAGLSFFDQNGVFHLWKFGADNRVHTPSGGFLLEGLTTADGHVWLHNNPGWPDSILAALADVQNETMRATTAEASLVSGLGYGGDNQNVVRLWIGSGGAICIRDQAGTVRFVQQTGDVASASALANEIFRATTSEASLVSGLGYGGDNQNVVRLWIGSGGTVCVRDQGGTVRYLATAGSSDSTLIQAFTVTGYGNQPEPFVTFPKAFSSRPHVVAIVSREDKASGYSNSRYVALNNNNDDPLNPQITTTGFWAQVVTTTSVAADTTRSWSMEVIAIGKGA